LSKPAKRTRERSGLSTRMSTSSRRRAAESRRTRLSSRATRARSSGTVRSLVAEGSAVRGACSSQPYAVDLGTPKRVATRASPESRTCWTSRWS
jgi:hypothetical protein